LAHPCHGEPAVAEVHKEVKMNMNQYEVMYVIDAALEDSARTELINRFSDLVTKNGGEVDRVDEWGKRRLAYAIQYKTEGYYVLMYIKAPAELPREIERNMQISDSILRYLTVRYEGELPAKREPLKPYAPREAAPVAEAAAPAAAPVEAPAAPAEAPAEAPEAEIADDEKPVSEAE
jgi:small subunit ribosomal protein S6